MTIYEIIAILLAASRFVLAAAGIVLCVLLFRRARNFGWLLVGVVFLEPFYRLAIRMARGLPLLNHWSHGKGRGDGVAIIVLNYDFPLYEICAVLGLWLLLRRVQREKPATVPESPTRPERSGGPLDAARGRDDGK
jgi:hypothetical protein